MKKYHELNFQNCEYVRTNTRAMSIGANQTKAKKEKLTLEFRLSYTLTARAHSKEHRR